MSKHVLILDTSVLCCWLQVPGKETAGSQDNLWTFKRIDTLVSDACAKGATLVLPLASLIETGNHIAQAAGDRFKPATKLAAFLRKAADADSPWVAFTEQADLWQEDNLRSLADSWPELAKAKISIGDATITDVAKFYSEIKSYSVEIVTADQGLKAYEPAKSEAKKSVPKYSPNPPRRTR